MTSFYYASRFFPSPPLSVPRFKRAPNSRRWILSSAWHRHANTKQFNNATEISRAPLQDKYPVAAQHPTTVFTQEVPSFFVFPIRRVQFISAVVKPWGCNFSRVKIQYQLLRICARCDFKYRRRVLHNSPE